MSAIKRLIANLTLLFGGIVLALLVIEGGFRLIQAFAPPRPKSDRPLFYYLPERAATMQDRVYPPKSDAFRVVVVGDSFSFAPRMQFDDAFPKRLERMLNLNEGARAEVLNAGIPGVSTIHEALGVEHALARGADFVLLQITLNDLQEKPFSPRELAWAKRFGPLKLQGLPAVIARHWRSLGFALERLHNVATSRAYVEYYHSLLTDDANRRQFEEGLRRMAASRDRAGKKLAAVIFPLFGVSLDRDYPFAELHRYFAERLAKHNIPTLDLLELYRGLPQSRLQVYPGVDLHPGEIAHRLAAEKIYLWLTEEKLLPPELEIRRSYKHRTTLKLPKKPERRKAKES